MKYILRDQVSSDGVSLIIERTYRCVPDDYVLARNEAFVDEE